VHPEGHFDISGRALCLVHVTVSDIQGKKLVDRGGARDDFALLHRAPEMVFDFPRGFDITDGVRQSQAHPLAGSSVRVIINDKSARTNPY